MSFDPRLLPDAVAAGLAAVPFWEQGGRPHLLTGLEPGRDGLLALLQLARAVRDGADDLARQRPLAGRVVAGMFFDRSLRTRASMAVACAKLGAEFLDLEPGDSLWTLEFQDEVTMDGLAAEHVREAAGVLGRYADVVGLRSFAGRGRWERERTQPIHAAFAAHAGVPVVNLEGPFAHPCQGIADALTIQDLLPAGGGRVVLTWTPHPEQQPVSAPHSALWAATALGAEVVLARPKGFELDPEAVTHARALAAQAGASLTVTDNRDEALADADIVYAKSWGALDGYAATLSGHADAVAALRNWTVHEADLRRGKPARFLHPLPVRRGVVASDAVLDGGLSSVLDQAENRLWAQAALLLALCR